jgi:hypothetical protein
MGSSARKVLPKKKSYTIVRRIGGIEVFEVMASSVDEAVALYESGEAELVDTEYDGDDSDLSVRITGT